MAGSHASIRYDVIVDTTAASSEERVRAVLSHMQSVSSDG